MAKRGHIHDFTGQEIREGDTLVYAARRGNSVRMVEAVVLRTYTENYKGRVLPMLKVKPTGNESGWVKRATFRVETVAAEHVAVTVPAEVPAGV
ncbi:hypothetical protein SAZ_26260 [Streptomyces noursei ZPM]|uniref:50S ribosomal protein L19 n=1 Tax=Streptomyces noursei TaxID=1971 RepID=A0A401R633_STRNR|nr:hypothetical protein [Streptomyces noursei]AKA05558.1 hypothetical protein SAZ_26260 [Streptomyces noursei ZPM]EOT05137.1 hypothetical protein K530_05053 [Streptomyces noursei CCRC 11814]EXU90246.1 hypothetical protein P354_17635 [Streptomyces noursei PD-1]MCZ0970792.1 hypothetical protein [Streptomyces noursei]UWS73960.1 hypothetical protein N1H47_23565 [Streptomyces noursei]